MKKETAEFILCLFNARTQAHIFHLQVKKTMGSGWAHSALNGFYDGIIGLADRYAESYQGKYDVIDDYDCEFKPTNFTDIECVIEWLEKLAFKVEKHREEVKDGFLQQICDDIIELMYSTLYKLKYLP